MHPVLTTILELAGFALITAGAAVLALWLGLVVAGTACVALAFLLAPAAPALDEQ